MINARSQAAVHTHTHTHTHTLNSSVIVFHTQNNKIKRDKVAMQ